MIRIVTVYGNDTVTISIIYRHYLFSMLNWIPNQPGLLRLFPQVDRFFLNRISILSRQY